jgi:uncharacterized protein
MFELSQFGPISLVVIQPTPFCNLDCDYCYLPNRNLKNRLSLDLIGPIFKEIFTSRFFDDNFTVCWHAGEPLAVPISFYKSAFDLINEAAQEYRCKDFSFNHSFQTNGTLITQAWCDLFNQHPVHVGVSIDGPAFIHDAHRKTRTGKGSHAQTLRGIHYLQKNQIPYSVIAVLTEDSLDYPDEIFSFFRENNITDIGFNMEETEGIHKSSSLDKQGIQERYRTFIKRFWDLTAQYEQEFKVREFEATCSLIYTEERLNYTEMNHPFSIVNIDHQGNFATFDPELLSVKTERYGDFILGNILKDSLESVCHSEKFKKIYQDIQDGVNLCRQTCSYFGMCGGGAGSNKYWENGSFNSSETKACQYRIQVITDLIVEELENSLGFLLDSHN